MTVKVKLPLPVMMDASGFNIDPSYQRLPEDRIGDLRKTAEVFDPQKFGVILVTKRADGRWFIIDGAGRCFIWYVLLKFTGPVPCIVVHPTVVPEEAKLFVGANKHRRVISSGNMFKAEVTALDKECVEIQEIFDSVDMTVGGGRTTPRNVASVQSVKTVHRYGDDLLLRSLCIKKKVWETHVCGGGLLEAIALVLRAVPNIDDTGFRKVLSQKLPEATMALLKVRGSGRLPLKRYIPEWAAELWATDYNHRRKKQRADIARIRRLATEPKPDPEDDSE